MTLNSLALGVDIGGTKIAFALIDAVGSVVAEYRLPTQPADGTAAVIDRVAQGIEYLLAQADRPVAGIGIGCPGYINPREGIAENAVNLGWRDVPLRAELQSRLSADLPIWMHKDADAATIGELRFGAGRDCQDFVNVAIGTGLGLSALVNGQLVIGSRFAAMEIGHVVYKTGGRLCGCGQHGCAEMYASGLGLLAGAAEHRLAYPHSSLANLSEISNNDILLAAEHHDPLADKLVDEMVECLSWVIGACMGLLNPARMILGGGLGLVLADRLTEPLLAGLAARTLPIAREGFQIVRSEVQSSAVGAGALVWHYMS